MMSQISMRVHTHTLSHTHTHIHTHTHHTHTHTGAGRVSRLDPSSTKWPRSLRYVDVIHVDMKKKKSLRYVDVIHVDMKKNTKWLRSLRIFKLKNTNAEEFEVC